MFESDPFRDFRQEIGNGHMPAPRGNTSPQFSSVLPSTSPLARGVLEGGSLKVQVLYYEPLHPKPEFLTLRRVAPAEHVNAKDLELAGEVALFREIMKDWDLNDQQASAVLGYAEPSFASELFKGLVTIRQRDAEERLQTVITLAVDLEALYRDVDVIRKWLRKPHSLLDGAIPLKLATEGSSVDLLRLSEYVEYLSGR